MSENTYLQVVIPVKLKKRLSKEAKKRGQSVSQLVVEAIRKEVGDE